MKISQIPDTNNFYVELTIPYKGNLYYEYPREMFVEFINKVINAGYFEKINT